MTCKWKASKKDKGIGIIYSSQPETQGPCLLTFFCIRLQFVRTYCLLSPFVMTQHKHNEWSNAAVYFHEQMIVIVVQPANFDEMNYALTLMWWNEMMKVGCSSSCPASLISPFMKKEMQMQMRIIQPTKRWMIVDCCPTWREKMNDCCSFSFAHLDVLVVLCLVLLYMHLAPSWRTCVTLQKQKQ